MTAVTHARPALIDSQFGQNGSFFGSLLSSVCESTDSAFRRVYVNKKDAQGNIKQYQIADSQTGHVTQSSTLQYIEDIKTGALYLDEPGYLVSIKCACIVFAMPIYTLGKIAWNIGEIIVKIGKVTLKIFSQFGTMCLEFNFKEGVQQIVVEISQMGIHSKEALFEIIRAPIFGIGCTMISLYGIAKPYHGRKFEAWIENVWQHRTSYRDDFRCLPARPGEDCLESFIKDIQVARPFYLAHCFQIRGNVNESRVTVLQQEAL